MTKGDCSNGIFDVHDSIADNLPLATREKEI